MSGLDVAALRVLAEAADRAPLPSTERDLAWQAFEWECDPETVLTLLDRLEAAEAIARLAEESEAGWRRDADEAWATVERVRALAEQAKRTTHGRLALADDIRAALDQPAPTTPGGDA